MDEGHEQSKPRYIVISDDIKSKIANGKLRAGDALPSVRDLATQYNSSISTIQRAYDQLESAGYLERIPGKETRVSALMGRVETPSTAWKVFWSYAHRDDELTGGRVTELKQDIQSEYEVQTGEVLDVFQDSEGIGWGVDWRKVIGDNLGTTSFFIPILTPTYLRRPHCLAELKAAFYRFSELKYERGIYPIEFADITTVLGQMEDDEIAHFLDSCQRFPGVDLRVEERSSAVYKKAIRKIVQSLIERDRELRGTQINLERQRAEMVDSEVDDRGIIDVVNDVNAQCEELTENVNGMASGLQQVGEVFSSSHLKANSTPKQMLATIMRISNELAPMSLELRERGSKYRNSVKKLDGSISTLMELSEFFGNVEGAAKAYKALSDLRDTSRPVFSQVESLMEALSTVEKISRQFRKPCADIRSALEDFLSSEAYFSQWVERVRPLITE